MRGAGFILIGLAGLVLSSASQVLGQSSTINLIDRTPVLDLARAGRIAPSPDGRLFVTDRDRDLIYVLSSSLEPLDRLGGPGSDEGEFDDPADVDPGIGLVIAVADADNGRIQRFTGEFRFLESIPVDASEAEMSADDDPSFRAGSAGLRLPASGRPVAVSSSTNDDLYVIDAEAGVVIRWDRERRRRWIIGQGRAGTPGLVEPVDLAVWAGLLYVADRRVEGVLVFDLFGGFVRSIQAGRLSGIRAVNVASDELLIVLPDRILTYTSEGTFIGSTDVVSRHELVDAVRQEARLLLLTERALYAVQVGTTNR